MLPKTWLWQQRQALPPKPRIVQVLKASTRLAAIIASPSRPPPYIMKHLSKQYGNVKAIRLDGINAFFASRKKGRSNCSILRLRPLVSDSDRINEWPRYWSRSEESTPKVICSLHDPFREVLEFHTYRLANNSDRHANQVSRNFLKSAKHLEAQMESKILFPSWSSLHHLLHFIIQVGV